MNEDRGFGLCPKCGRALEVDYLRGKYLDICGDLLGVWCPVASTWCSGYKVPLADMTRKQRKLAEARYKDLKDNWRADTGRQRDIGHPSEFTYVRHPNVWRGPGSRFGG